jgi:thiol-disulfide isomerase/thioredoxin
MPYTQNFFISKDTLYAEKYYSVLSAPYEMIAQTGNEGFCYNNENGRRSSAKYQRPKIQEQNFKRTRKNAETILNLESERYEAESTFFKVKIWIAKENIQLPTNLFFTTISFKGHLILKKEVFFKRNGITKTTLLQNLSRTTPNPLKPKLKAIEKLNDADRMYATLPENEKIKPQKLAVHATAPDLYFHKVQDYQKTSLHSFKANGKYTILEFWGTWCSPCLAATPKLKAFYAKHKSSVDMISFNCKDLRSDYVKKVIEIKGMNWQQAYGTKKLIEILNPPGGYPTIVLLDDKMEVLLIGNPHKHLEEIESIIGS